MLKIKDNVDLKELEKFGFEKYQDYYNNVYRSDCDNSDILFINVTNRYIYCEDCSGFSICEDGSLNALFDLIQAGLVEKVEGEEK